MYDQKMMSEFIAAHGGVSHSDLRIAADPEHGGCLHARQRIYAALERAAGHSDGAHNGSTAAERAELARAMLAAWPTAAN